MKIFTPVSRSASAKSGENNAGHVRLQGIAIFAEAGAWSERQQGERLQPRFSQLVRERPRAKGSLLLTSLLVTLWLQSN